MPSPLRTSRYAPEDHDYQEAYPTDSTRYSGRFTNIPKEEAQFLNGAGMAHTTYFRRKSL